MTTPTGKYVVRDVEHNYLAYDHLGHMWWQPNIGEAEFIEANNRGASMVFTASRDETIIIQPVYVGTGITPEEFASFAKDSIREVALAKLTPYERIVLGVG